MKLMKRHKRNKKSMKEKENYRWDKYYDQNDSNLKKNSTHGPILHADLE